MDTIKIDKKGVKLIAHRGLSGIEAENTNAAFVAAGNRSYFGIETDVHVTADGKFVVIHDDDAIRVAGQNASTEQCSYDLLAQIPLYDKEPGRFRSDLRMPQLHEYIRICKRYGKTAVLELKNTFPTEELPRVVEVIRREEYLEHTVFISFYWENMAGLRALLPEQPLQLLLGGVCTQEYLDMMIPNRIDMDIHFSFLTPELVKTMHGNGLKVNVWTVDDPEVAVKMIDMGVDYITSNILE